MSPFLIICKYSTNHRSYKKNVQTKILENFMIFDFECINFFAKMQCYHVKHRKSCKNERYRFIINKLSISSNHH